MLINVSSARCTYRRPGADHCFLPLHLRIDVSYSKLLEQVKVETEIRTAKNSRNRSAAIFLSFSLKFGPRVKIVFWTCNAILGLKRWKLKVAVESHASSRSLRLFPSSVFSQTLGLSTVWKFVPSPMCSSALSRHRFGLGGQFKPPCSVACFRRV